MESATGAALAGRDIHGFLTVADLNVEKLMKEAAVRWFRPNEIYALLANHGLFRVQAQPIGYPASGTVALYDRKIVRNFRKDGLNWKKKKDGKTVQEAHEKLKIGNEERIHVYYARGEDDPSFFRRCYWLLDKEMERFVLVHYRQTSEDNMVAVLPAEVECLDNLSSENKTHDSSQMTSVDSTSVSTYPEMPSTAVMTEVNSDLAPRNHQQCHDDIENFWEGVLKSSMNSGPVVCGEGVPFATSQNNGNALGNSTNGIMNTHSANTSTDAPSPNLGVEVCSSVRLPPTLVSDDAVSLTQGCGGVFEVLNNLENASVKTANYCWQFNGYEFDSIGKNSVADNARKSSSVSHEIFRENSIGEDILSLLNDDASATLALTEQPVLGKISFNITDITPEWAFSTEETKVIVAGYFREDSQHLVYSKMYCVFGSVCVPTELIQTGVYRCKAMPNVVGSVKFFMTLDGRSPISQVVNFEYREKVNNLSNFLPAPSEYCDNKFNLRVKTRLAYLLFSASTKKARPTFRGDSSRAAALASVSLEDDWLNQFQLSNNDSSSYLFTIEKFLDLVLRNKLQEWILEKTIEGCKIIAHDALGQGVIHLCAILDYAWAVRLFSLSEISLDFRDAHGWTALHWAAYYGREKMVATLLSAGANPSLVTDPSPDYPGGCTAADLAANKGYEGIAAYLAEKGLAAHFEAMSLSGNLESGGFHSLGKAKTENFDNLSEQEVCLKESLAAYRNAADVASHIQAALRERALKLQIKDIESAKADDEATHIVAAMKIQNAFRNHSKRKVMLAAARIQSHYRTWKTRKTFLNMRRQAIKIQAVFRGHRVRKQYLKIIWSVGVVEKAVLRWRKKRKGLRGIHIKSDEAMVMDAESTNTEEEDFFRVSREQAEDRYKRSVVRVQALFRSYRAQQEYRRMKMAYEQAKSEYTKLSEQP